MLTAHGLEIVLGIDNIVLIRLARSAAWEQAGPEAGLLSIRH